MDIKDAICEIPNAHVNAEDAIGSRLFRAMTGNDGDNLINEAVCEGRFGSGGGDTALKSE